MEFFSNEQKGLFDTKFKGISLADILRLYVRSTGAVIGVDSGILGISIITTAGTYVIFANSSEITFKESGRVNG